MNLNPQCPEPQDAAKHWAENVLRWTGRRPTPEEIEQRTLRHQETQHAAKNRTEEPKPVAPSPGGVAPPPAMAPAAPSGKMGVLHFGNRREGGKNYKTVKDWVSPKMQEYRDYLQEKGPTPKCIA